MLRIDEILAARAKDHDLAKDGPLYSFEYYPPKSELAVQQLYKRMWRMGQQKPVFMDVTWGAGGSTSDLTFDLCFNPHKHFGLTMNMHLTCTNMPAEKITKALEDSAKAGIHNIVALRGDPPAGEDKWKAVEGGFTCALDLVKHTKATHKERFCLSVAGYPEGHPTVINKVEDVAALTDSEKGRLVDVDGVPHVCSDADFVKEMEYLKSKVDAGASFIITQLFYDTAVFVSFVKACREIGITCPILPGIMPIANQGGFKRMIGFCKTRIPEAVKKSLASAGDDKALFKAAGLQITTQICKELLDTGLVTCLHFYTLNTEENTYTILRALGVAIKSKDELKGAEMDAAYEAVHKFCPVEKKKPKEVKEDKPVPPSAEVSTNGTVVADVVYLREKREET